jgi:histidine triad (HIT) family protein
MDDCLFCRIVSGTIPAKKVYEDEMVTAFWDIEPQAPVHVLLIPNVHVGSINELDEAHEGIVGHVFRTARTVAAEVGVGESGFRLVVNTGADAMMTVPHLHVHLLGGRHLGWPPG